LWKSIRTLDFDDPMDGATAAAIQSRAAVVRNGGELTAADFAINDKVAQLGGIHEVRRAIARDWTIEEVQDFFEAWNGETNEVKKALMGGGEDAERRAENFTATMRTVYDSALIAIGAKCYADCKRNDTSLALGLDTGPYYRQTLKDLEKTLPPPLVALIQNRFDGLEPVKAGVDYLVDKKVQGARNAQKAQERAKNDPDIAAAKQRAAEDMKKALQRVADDPGVKAKTHGALLAACRRVCREFQELTRKKNEITGKFLSYAPLKDWQGKPIKPETLAKRFREKYGTARERKARAKKRGNR